MSDERKSTGWTLEQARQRVGELQSAYDEVHGDLAAASQDLIRVTYERDAARTERDIARDHLRLVERDLIASETRERALASELVELKRSIGAGHTSIGHATPILPPKRGEE